MKKIILCILAGIVSLSVVTAQEGDLKNRRWSAEIEMNMLVGAYADGLCEPLSIIAYVTRDYRWANRFYGGWKTGIGTGVGEWRFIAVPILFTMKYEFISGCKFIPYTRFDLGVSAFMDVYDITSNIPIPIPKAHLMLGVDYVLSNTNKIYFTAGCGYLPHLPAVTFSFGYLF